MVTQLAKLLIGVVAWISGFKGDFEFAEIGKYVVSIIK